MAADQIAIKQVVELRHLIEGVAKNFVERVYGPEGPAWGTSFTSLEELAVQIGQAVSQQMLNKGLQQQASQPVPAENHLCPSCSKPVEPAPPEPRIVATRAGEAHWLEPHSYCPSCRRAFFPSVAAAGD
jgi:hypothetical protein